MSSKQDRYKRLPKWTQEEIRNLKQEVVRAREHLSSEAHRGSGFVSIGENEPLPDDAQIEFKMEGKDTLMVRRMEAKGQVFLEVHSSTGISIRPSVANVARIYAEERW